MGIRVAPSARARAAADADEPGSVAAAGGMAKAIAAPNAL